MQKHPNFWQFSPEKFQSSLTGRKIFVLSESLSEISPELECMHYYLLLLFRIHLSVLLLLVLLLLLLLLLPLLLFRILYNVPLSKRKKISASPIAVWN